MSNFRTFINEYYQVNEVYNLAAVAVRRVLLNKLLSKLSPSKTFKMKDISDTINNFGQKISELNPSEIAALRANVTTVISDLISAGKLKLVSPGVWRVVAVISAEDTDHEDTSVKLNNKVLDFMNKRLRKAMTSPEFTKDDIINYIDVNNIFDFKPEDLPEISTILDKLLKNAIDKKILELSGNKYKFKKTALGAKTIKFVLEEFLPSKNVDDEFKKDDVTALAVDKLNPGDATEEADISGNVSDTLDEEIAKGNLILLPGNKIKVKNTYNKSNAKEKIYEFLKTLSVNDTFSRKKLIDSIDDAPDDDDIDEVLQKEINDGRLKLIANLYMVIAPFTDVPSRADLGNVVKNLIIDYIKNTGKGKTFLKKNLVDKLVVETRQYNISRAVLEEKTIIILRAAIKQKLIKQVSLFRMTEFEVLKDKIDGEWRRTKDFANIGLGAIGVEYVGFKGKNNFDIDNLKTSVERKTVKHASEFFKSKSINYEFKTIDIITAIESAERFSIHDSQEIKSCVDLILSQLVDSGHLLETGKNTPNHKYRIKQEIKF